MRLESGRDAHAGLVGHTEQGWTSAGSMQGGRVDSHLHFEKTILFWLGELEGSE